MHLRLILPSLLVLLTGLSNLPAAPEDAFAVKSFQDGNFSLNYRIYVPENLSAGEKVPLVLFLHGAGERGDDNTAQLKFGARDLLKYVRAHQIPAIIVAPQCPKNMKWVEVPWSADSHTMPPEPSVPMHAVIGLLDQCMQDYPVAPDRVYVTGLSMGGFGTWDLIQRQPDRFAAAIPICGGGDIAQAPRLVNLPIWTFHGEIDPTVKVERSRDMIAAIEAAGGHPKYTEYPGVKHGSWGRTYANPKTLEWFFAQQRGTPAVDVE